MKNKTNKQVLLNNLNTAIVKSKNGILLEELNIVPKNIMLKPYAKDTFVIVTELLIEDLTEKKVNSFVEDVKKITISLGNEFNEERLEIVLSNDYKFYVK